MCVCDILKISPRSIGIYRVGDNRRTVNTSTTPHISDQLGTENACETLLCWFIVMIWALVCDNMYWYGRHFGSFYHNLTIFETVLETVAWVNTEIVLIETQRHEIILSPMCLCWCKMWKSNVKNIFISHVGLPELTWPHGSPGTSLIAQSLTMSAHSQQSERQNIIDRTHT